MSKKCASPRGDATRAGRRGKRRAPTLLLCTLMPAAALAQSTADGAAGAAQLAPVVVSATRSEARAFDVAAAIDRIDGDAVRNNREQVNISESLGGVPGLLARDRQ